MTEKEAFRHACDMEDPLVGIENLRARSAGSLKRLLTAMARSCCI